MCAKRFAIKAPPQAVLFDFDGVLADTANVHIAAWERTFDWMGWDVPADECAISAEIDDRHFLKLVFEKRKLNGGDVDGWVAHKQRITEAMLRDAPRLMPGAQALVVRLAGLGLRLAVVTDTWRSNVAAVLSAAGLAEKFELIIAKEDVPRPKPDPDGYKLALRKLKLAAKYAASIEDSMGGLMASELASLRCLVVRPDASDQLWARRVPRATGLEDTNEILTLLGVEQKS